MMAKNDNYCSSWRSHEMKAFQLLEALYLIKESPQSLVEILNNNKYYNLPRWKTLNSWTKLTILCYFLIDKNEYKAFSLRFSREMMAKIQNDSKPLDYIRRKISQSLKKELGYTPLYLFGIHNEDNGNIHIHGMIKIENNQKAVTKTLKIAACGRKYKTMSINKNILRITNLNCAYGWLKYIFKYKQYDEHIYVCRKLIQENQKFYERMKRRLLRIKKNFI